MDAFSFLFLLQQNSILVLERQSPLVFVSSLRLVTDSNQKTRLPKLIVISYFN
uniref:Uncharacterized protein n=1 Tax=Anguilla anguilla TaxID=7936 RepID=A0A0E9RJQ7_ANGAN